MMNRWVNLCRAGAAFFAFAMFLGCGSRPEEARTPSPSRPAAQEAVQPLTAENAETLPAPEIVPVSAASTAAKGSKIAVKVNGAGLTETQLNAEVEKKAAFFQGQVPAERLKQLKPEIRKQIVDDFIARTLLNDEIKKKKISASDREVKEAVEGVKAGLPKGATLDDLLKKNGMDMNKLKEEISLGIRVNKLVMSQTAAGIKPTERDVAKYYNDNKEKFKTPEAVHARHILVAKKEGDDEKARAEKRAKAEALRKQLTEGADFAELAAKHSDDGSRQAGGDLGTFTRGQMVKPFEDASFSQKVNAIGPVVETEFGYHIIQVLEHRESKAINLDGKTKKEIGLFLQQQRREEAFAGLLKRLRAKATIIVSGQ